MARIEPATYAAPYAEPPLEDHPESPPGGLPSADAGVGQSEVERQRALLSELPAETAALVGDLAVGAVVNSPQFALGVLETVPLMAQATADALPQFVDTVSLLGWSAATGADALYQYGTAAWSAGDSNLSFSNFTPQRRIPTPVMQSNLVRAIESGAGHEVAMSQIPFVGVGVQTEHAIESGNPRELGRAFGGATFGALLMRYGQGTAPLLRLSELPTVKTPAPAVVTPFKLPLQEAVQKPIPVSASLQRAGGSGIEAGGLAKKFLATKGDDGGNGGGKPPSEPPPPLRLVRPVGPPPVAESSLPPVASQPEPLTSHQPHEPLMSEPEPPAVTSIFKNTLPTTDSLAWHVQRRFGTAGPETVKWVREFIGKDDIFDGLPANDPRIATTFDHIERSKFFEYQTPGARPINGASVDIAALWTKLKHENPGVDLETAVLNNDPMFKGTPLENNYAANWSLQREVDNHFRQNPDTFADELFGYSEAPPIEIDSLNAAFEGQDLTPLVKPGDANPAATTVRTASEIASLTAEAKAEVTRLSRQVVELQKMGLYRASNGFQDVVTMLNKFVTQLRDPPPPRP
jgi:hypothetical protein